MLYRVRAQIIEEKTAEFLEKLTDDSIEQQRPDGQEIVASISRAQEYTMIAQAIVLNPCW